MYLDTYTLLTPAGPLTVLAADDAVRAAGFTDRPDALLALVHSGLRGPLVTRSDLGGISKAVTAYLDGDLAALDAVPVRQQTDGAFRGHAWQVMRDIAAGRPESYAAFAARAGRPAAVRAAAAACAHNAAALFVPCHRVLRSDGGLGGYRWGLAVKRWLLDHEAGSPALTTRAASPRVP